MTETLQRAAARPRTVLSIEALAALDPDAQSKYCTNIVGNDVVAGEIEGLLYLAEFGKPPHSSMWAVFALGRAQPFADTVLPKLTELLRRNSNTGRFRGNLAETIGKLPGSLLHIELLFEHYNDEKLETEYRGVVGCAIVRVLAEPTLELEHSVAVSFIGGPLGQESPACGVLRHLIDTPVHDSVVEAALKALLRHPVANYMAARSAVEVASRNRYAEAIAKAGKEVLARF